MITIRVVISDDTFERETELKITVDGRALHRDAHELTDRALASFPISGEESKKL